MTVLDRQFVLVVEDDPEIQFLLSSILSGEGRKVVAVSTGSEGLEVLASDHVDLVILDLILPDVDGRFLLSKLRESPETAAVPVVVVTARAGPETRRDCYALGADAFVEKPFDPDEFAAEIAVRLERAAQAERAALTDALTGLLNRAGLQESVPREASGYGLGLLEVDGFDGYAERWGWDKTERVERELAEALRGAIPEGVALARVGGGDYAMLMSGADLTTIKETATHALEVVKGLGGDTLGEDSGELTATIGVVAAEVRTPLEDALELAQRRLFQARAAAGDHVVSADGGFEGGGTRVLVAEDDEISATILVHRLEKEGLSVVRFKNGQQALDAALADPPDLLVLDVKMPGLDGFEVLERLRKNPSFASTPVIMLTSMGQEADVVRGFRLGADDYILKPFSPIELSARVRRLLRRGRSPSAV